MLPDIHIRLVLILKADQAIRGTVTFHHGTGKPNACWCCTLIKKLKAKMPVLTMLVWMSLFRKIEGGWVDVDVMWLPFRNA